MNALDKYKCWMIELEIANRRESEAQAIMDKVWAQLTEDEKKEARNYSYAIQKLTDQQLKEGRNNECT